MIVLKVTTFLLVFLAVEADKKIELEDIEEDNLRSEKENDVEKSDSGPQTGPSEQGLIPLEFLKSGFLRYFENPTQAPQQQHYVHQYDVTEAPERSAPTAPSKPLYTSGGTQQAMVGYYSNVPMQIYLVPHYYTNQPDQGNNHPGPPYQTTGVARVNGYQTAPEAVQTQTNYIEVPSGKPYVPQYTQPSYVYPAQASVPYPQPAIAPVTYQSPVVQYQAVPVVAPTTAPKVYYQRPQYETNTVDEGQDHEDEHKHYTSEIEIPYHKPAASEFPRYYNSRAPIRADYRHNTISELPHPNPIILKAQPPHLAHTPKVLPMYRPLIKPVYQSGGIVAPFPHRPHEGGPYTYGPPPPFKRRPTSLLDSYIPSSVQIEYLKRGLVKEPRDAYEAVASGRLPHLRHYERGFLPNQMYHTGAGGVSYGPYKRTPKIDKNTRK